MKEREHFSVTGPCCYILTANREDREKLKYDPLFSEDSKRELITRILDKGYAKHTREQLEQMSFEQVEKISKSFDVTSNENPEPSNREEPLHVPQLYPTPTEKKVIDLMYRDVVPSQDDVWNVLFSKKQRR
jgi:hypothetical protein